MPCEVQCPADPDDPYLYDFTVTTSFQYILDPRAGVTGGGEFFVTSVEAYMPVEHWQGFGSWGQEWLANTLGVDCALGSQDAFTCSVTKLDGNHKDGFTYKEDFVSYNVYHWLDINLIEEPTSSLKLETWDEDPRKRGVARTVIGSNPERLLFEPVTPYWSYTKAERDTMAAREKKMAAMTPAERAAFLVEERAAFAAEVLGGTRRRAQQGDAWQSEEPYSYEEGHLRGSEAAAAAAAAGRDGSRGRNTYEAGDSYLSGDAYHQGHWQGPTSASHSATMTAHDGVLKTAPDGNRYLSRETTHNTKNGYTRRGYEYMANSERDRYQHPDSPWTAREDFYDSEPAASASNAGLAEGRYFITVKADPIVRMDSILRNDFVRGRYTKADGVNKLSTDPIREIEYQSVPYSIRTTFIEPILLPSATDVNATMSNDIKTIYFFEVYLNQKVALELAGSDSPYEQAVAILSYEETTHRTDDWGFLGKGRLQTYHIQQNRPPGYDYMSLCPAEVVPGRYYVEMRSDIRANYTLRLSEYTPYCPNDCSHSTGQGMCDCTILRCICEPGYFGDDCSFEPAAIEIDSMPFQTGLNFIDRPFGWDSDIDGE